VVGSSNRWRAHPCTRRVDAADTPAFSTRSPRRLGSTVGRSGWRTGCSIGSCRSGFPRCFPSIFSPAGQCRRRLGAGPRASGSPLWLGGRCQPRERTQACRRRRWLSILRSARTGWLRDSNPGGARGSCSNLRCPSPARLAGPPGTRPAGGAHFLSGGEDQIFKET
jgi:hypothetical protein